MPAHIDTVILAEQALGHVLSEQQKLLKREDANTLTGLLKLLAELAIKTHELIRTGIKRDGAVGRLLKLAKDIEKQSDDFSEVIWKYIPLSVSAVYERMEEALARTPGSSTAKDIIDQYHNLRIRLLEQAYGARMLTNNNDLGEEHERIWQQFLQRQLGADFQVLRGGHILDHKDKRSIAQIDLIVVRAGATVVVPGDSEGGKANVFIDDVIAAIMLTTNLTTQKFKEDWGKLQSLPEFVDKAKDFPQLEKHAWPLCYVFSSQSCSIEALADVWVELVRAGMVKVVPQLVVSLDGGAMFSGAMTWPRPCYPGNYVQADQVHAWTGLDAGMGIAWPLLQMKGRLRVIENRAFGSIQRFKKLLDNAVVKPATPATWSPRFDTMFQMVEIAGKFSWGSVALFVHNRLQLRSLSREVPGKDRTIDIELYQPGVDLEKLDWRERSKYNRWFHYGVWQISGGLLALEEWENPRCKNSHRKRIAVFNVVTGVELEGAAIDALQDVADACKLVANPVIPQADERKT